VSGKPKAGSRRWLSFRSRAPLPFIAVYEIIEAANEVWLLRILYAAVAVELALSGAGRLRQLVGES
jgi:hypothetical protein